MGGTSLKKKILQAVIPKTNKSYALEKIPADKRAFKKIDAPKIFHPPPVISNGPSLSDLKTDNSG